MQTIRKFSLALAVIMMLSCVLLTGCQNGPSQTVSQQTQ